MSEIEWGPEIKVGGKRPEWFGHRERHQWIGKGVKDWGSWDTGTNFIRDNPSDCWDIVTAIRLPADHPYYAKPELSGADGSSYYDLQINGVTVSCNDVIDALGMNFNMGEAFKALWRCGRKPGTSKKYDLDKVVRFAQREANRDA